MSRITETVQSYQKTDVGFQVDLELGPFTLTRQNPGSPQPTETAFARAVTSLAAQHQHEQVAASTTGEIGTAAFSFAGHSIQATSPDNSIKTARMQGRVRSTTLKATQLLTLIRHGQAPQSPTFGVNFAKSQQHVGFAIEGEQMQVVHQTPNGVVFSYSNIDQAEQSE